MPRPLAGPALSASQDPIIHWLADLLSSEARLGEWLQLADGQRQDWLNDEGYSAPELQASLSSLAAAEGVDPAQLGAIERFLLHGETIPEPLRPALATLLQDRMRQVEALAGGTHRGLSLLPSGLVGPHLLADYTAAHGAAAKASKLLQEARQTQLGRYIEDVGGIEDKGAAHITKQIDTEALKARTAAQTKAAPLIALKDNEQKAYVTKKQHFITQREDKAVTAESNEIAKFHTAQANGKYPVQVERASGAPRPVLGSKEKALVQDDKTYFQDHYLATLQAGLVIKPSFIVSGEGSTRSVSLSYDWDGTRGSVELDKATAAAELDPALGALNRLTARALWSARQGAAIATWESQQLPHWQAQLTLAHPKLSSQLSQAQQTNFPKAKLPTSFSQFTQQGQAGAAALRSSLQTRERRAERHGVTLFSLQRHRDAKRLQQKPLLQALSDPAHRLVHAEPALRSALRSQLQAMALAVLVADVDKQLASNSKAEALHSKAKTLASSHAARLSALQAQLANSSTTLSFSDRQIDLSWTLGEGVQFSRSAKDSTAAYAAEPTLTLESQGRNDAQNSLRLSATYAPGGQVRTSFFRSREDGAVVRQFGNSYSLSSTWQQRLKGFQTFGGVELQAYRASLQSSARKAAAVGWEQHAGLQSRARLDAFGQRAAKNASTIHKVLHDVRVDRRIEARIQPHYGSLRAQKLLMNQLQHDRQSYIQAASAMRRVRNVKSLIRQDLTRSIHEWKLGVSVDQGDLAIAAKIYKTNPYSVEKNSSGHGYQIVRTGPRKDFWQKLTEKQRYAIFNPIYHSEAIFYKSERTAFLAGAGEYTALRRDGASKKMARLGASATYFNTLLLEDKALYKTGLAKNKLVYAPFILRRQLHLAKRVVHLNRHSFAWRLRLSWKVKRERFLHKHVAAYEQYMLNNKFTGFHPFHRIARKSMNLIKNTWHFVLYPIVHYEDQNFLRIVSIFSPSAASWVAKAGSTLFKGVKYLSYHALKALWHLPEHLYHHTVYFGKQLLFAVTHPWEYRKIWTGIKKDFRGIYRLAKTVGELLVWLTSTYYRAIFQVGRWMTGQGANWNTITHGAFHKKIWHKAKLVHYAFKFAGLAALVGKTAATRDAIKIEMLRMQLRRDLHHDGFLASPWRRFVHQHKSFVQTQFDDIKPSQSAALVAAYKSRRAALHGDEKKLIKDFAKYKISANYRAQVRAKVTTAKARAASFTSKLKPHIQASLHTITHDILNETSNVSHKTKKIKFWTLRQYDLDISQTLRAAKAYRNLGKRGRKEVMVAIVAFKDLNRTHKTGSIKTTLQTFNRSVLAKQKTWKTFFTASSTKTSYAYALSQDWLHMGEFIGGRLLLDLQNSIHNTAASKEIGKLIRGQKLGESIFADIVGGFWLNHYDKLFVSKDAAMIAVIRADRSSASAKLRGLEMVLSQPPVHKLLTYWYERNQNSLIAKDARAMNVFARSTDKKIHKWERIEKIGHTEVTASDLTGLHNLHKNQMLGSSLADVIARTSSWQDLTLQQQAKDRASYDAWISYNQTTNHALTNSYSKFKKNNSSEYQAWAKEQSEIKGGDSLTVGSLLLSVKTNDSKHSSWVTIPKPSLANFNQHLEAAAANLASLAHDPRLLAVSVATHVSSHSGTTPVKPDPALWGYLMQIKHWSKKINKKLADRKAAKAKAEAAAKKAKEKEAKAKEEIKTDETTAKDQAKTAKEQLKDGSKDQKQIVKEAQQTDATTVENTLSNKSVDDLGKEIARTDPGDPKQLIQEAESGELKVQPQELEHAEIEEKRRLEQEVRQTADENDKVRDLEDVGRAQREIKQGEFKQDVESEAKGVVDEEGKLVDKELSDDAKTLESDAEQGLEQSLTDGSELVDKAVQDVERDTRIAEEDAVEVEGEMEVAAEAAAL